MGGIRTRARPRSALPQLAPRRERWPRPGFDGLAASPVVTNGADAGPPCCLMRPVRGEHHRHEVPGLGRQPTRPLAGYGQALILRDTSRMTATVLTLPLEFDDAPAPSVGGKDRCGRAATSTGMPCMSWPRRGAEACSHHITSEELAVLEQLLGRPIAAA